MRFSKCPKCDDTAYEKLLTHEYCLACNYSPEFELRDPEGVCSFSETSDPEPPVQLVPFDEEAHSSAA